MTPFQTSKLAQRAFQLLHRKGSAAGNELWPIVWGFVDRQTAGEFHRVADWIAAPLAGEADEKRTEALRLIVRALEDERLDLLEAQEQTSTKEI